MTSEESEIKALMSELKTRKKLIDPQFSKAGWISKYIKEELNSVKSDLKNKEYVHYAGSVEKGVDRFIDYVLLAEDYSPLAIIEAKKFSHDPDKGRVQARTYAKDIEEQVGYKIPIFLTNGQIWLYIDQHGRERKISGPFSQEDLKRRHELFINERNPATISISPKITDWPKSVLNVRILSEHFAKGHRNALIEMATGTGKTRVAMALIDVLCNANFVRNVLFVADRISLVNQAKSDGFKKFFNEPVGDLRQGITKTCRFYVSTVQTLMGKGKNKFFENFSSGFFDLIIFDEAHRSIYDKQNLIQQYFDAIKIGLTATPREHETKNTYKLFGCESGKPTVEYPYDEAVNDKILVKYRGKTILTEILSLGIKGSKLTSDLKDQLRKQEEEPEHFEVTGSQFDKIFMDDKTNELIIREFMDKCYKSDEGLPCKSIFFSASRKHAKRMKVIFGKLFPELSSHVQVITSDMDRSDDEVRRFKLNSEPRIALSVGILDTGVDIPEVCNLVFVKPVFSHIRFWQMVGRGTRSISACRHPEWLPNREKHDFLIFDFVIGGHSNLRYHEFKTEQEDGTSRDVITQIFKNRVSLLDKTLNADQKKIITQKILDDIKALNEDSFIVREKLSLVRKIKGTFDLEKYVKELKDEIAPLMILHHGKSPDITAFILKTEQLFRHILDNRVDKIGEIRAYIQERLENILQKDNISEVKNKKDKILRVMQEQFWEDLTFDKVEFIIKEIAELMRYYTPLSKKYVQVDAKDLVLYEEEMEYKIKEDTRLTELIEKNPIIKKIKSGEGITSKELLQLEKQISELNPSYTIENIQKILKKDFLVFIHEIIGLTHEYDPKELIEREFDKFIIEHDHYNSKQIEFLQLLKKVFAERKHIELKDFAREPLSGENPLDKFEMAELEVIVAKCNKIKMK